MYICICHALSRKDIGEAVKAGANGQLKVFSHFGVSPECGRCLSTVDECIKASQASIDPVEKGGSEIEPPSSVA